MIRYLADDILDSFRERVTPEDFAKEQVRRVRLVGEADFLAPVALRFFPDAETVTGEADAVVIAMTGGPTGPRLRALLSRVRHKLLVPSPDYVYRFGNRYAPGAFVTVVLDGLLFTPLALLIIPGLALWLCLAFARRLK